MSLVTRKLKLQRLTNKQLVVAGVLFFAVVILFFSLIFAFATKKEEKKEEKKVEPKEVSITVAESFGALFRSMAADKICYDEGRNGYFIHFKDDFREPWGGWWWYVDAPTFYKVSTNSSWFVTDIPNEKFTRIFPDVNGMPCATSEEYDNK